MTIHVIIRHRLSWWKPFLCIPAGSNFAHQFNQSQKAILMDRIKTGKMYKERTTAICDKQILLPCGNSKLCFCLTEQVPSDKNNLPFPYGRGRFAPKSQTLDTGSQFYSLSI